MMKPTVDHKLRLEEVDLQPGGATIAVRAPADNPYEDDGQITVVTQESGGMASPDPRQRSQRGRPRSRSNVLRQGQTAAVTASRMAVSGLGADAPGIDLSSTSSALQSLLNVGAGALAAKQEQAIAKEQAKAAVANAQATSATAGVTAALTNKKTMIGLAVAGVALVGLLIVMKSRKKKR